MGSEGMPPLQRFSNDCLRYWPVRLCCPWLSGGLLMAHHHARPLQLKSGEWGARVPAPNVRNGDRLTVVARSGSSWEAVVVGVVWQGPEAAICQTARGLMRCGCCGEVGQKGAYPFSTYPAEMQRCDDCGCSA